MPRSYFIFKSISYICIKVCFVVHTYFVTKCKNFLLKRFYTF